MEFTTTDEVNQVSVFAPHVIILGAGASRAAFPNGDRSGKRLPLMNEINDALDLAPLFKSWDRTLPTNFEDAFSQLYAAGDKKKTDELEARVYRYFSSLKLPNEPTLYDHLVLSLRDTDVIATFNWDPLLVEAYARNSKAGFKLPHLAFLHGNTEVGYCHKDKRIGNALLCPVCHEPYVPSKLLYPIGKKDYSSDPMIEKQWNVLKIGLKRAFMVTVFGYSGPKTDEEAIKIMNTAWGDPASRTLEQTVFITRDASNEDRLLKSFKGFVFSSHYSVYDNYFSSWIANHPRRTGEAWENQNLQGGFIDNNPAPHAKTLNELWAWYEMFKDPEEKAYARQASETKLPVSSSATPSVV